MAERIRATGLGAVLGGASWAAPAALHLAQVLAGNAHPTYRGWHHLHAAAGLFFAVFLAVWARQRATGGRERAGALGALGGAALFFVANAGEALTGLEVFVPLYGVGLLVLCLGLLAAGAARLADRGTRPEAWLLLALGAFPLSFASQALPAPAAWVLTDLAWLLFGLAWAWLGLLLPYPADRQHPLRRDR